MKKDLEIRKAPAAIINHIATILDIDNDWKKFMSLIPKDLNSRHFEQKYNIEHIRCIEEHAKNVKRSCTQILFDEWGTSGRKRPTLEHLEKLLHKAHMFRAAEHLADILGRPPGPRPNDGPGARVDVTGILNDIGISEQNIETRMVSDGSMNGNIEERGAASTMKLQSVRRITSSQDMPAFDKLYMHSTKMIANEIPALMEFPDTAPAPDPSTNTAKGFPRFDLLEPGNNAEISSISSSSDGSLVVSDSSQSPGNTSNHYEMPHPPQVFVPSMVTNNSLFEQLDKEILQDPNLIQYRYTEDLESITNRFQDLPIGSGGFGDVYKGRHEKHGMLAIKRAHTKQIIKSTDLMKIFNTEVKSLSALRHENIVTILGYSLDGLAPCIVCEYIEGGSLLENIKKKTLNKTNRMNIMIGTAEGLKHIHSTEKPLPVLPGTPSSPMLFKQYFMHGDVKSANILVTKDFVPKLCDLGLSKQCAATFHTESIVGTSAYMAPERFSGTITPKGDVYSYGIVLLELLTGLEPIVTGNESLNIKNYVEETCPNDDITDIIDPAVGDWPEALAIHNLAKSCLEHKKNLRPTMDLLCHTLQQIQRNERRVCYV